MTHFIDLTPYSYRAAGGSEAGALNVGWLSAGVEFPTTSPDLQFVNRLWRFCKVSIGQTRGLHECEICRSREANVVRLNEEELLLGSAEIRVISDQGQLYAAPNLIFHYVVSHNYSPPLEFVRAVLVGPCPPENSYYERLSKAGINWSNALVPDRSVKSFRFVKTTEGIVKVEE
jgi:hypothetical protein